MNPMAGWYQDPGRPPGYLRYWDGVRWTDRVAQPPPRASSPRPPVVAAPTSAGPGWVRRHKVATAVLALLVIGTIGNLVDGLDHSSASDTPARDADAPSGAGSSSDEATEDGADHEPSQQPRPGPGHKPRPTYLVAQVVDGDTIRMGNGESVRLVGIDTPEDGQCGSVQASQNLAGLILGERVRLTVSDEDRDRYGRLLRYVDLGSIDAGLRQIEDGFAIARYDSRDGYGYHPREPLYIRADKAAKDFSCPKPARLTDVGNHCAAGYSPCIRAFPPDLDCPDVDGPILVTGSDPHGLDADDDGVACE
jgi:endonuclease YncB( thermonuclease family)